jgi:predicted dehydrogenase
VDEVVVFGRTSEKLAQIGDDFGFATSTDLDAVLNDSSVDLVDICVPHPAARGRRGAGPEREQGRTH